MNYYKLPVTPNYRRFGAGFTLIELMLVVGIIGLLAGLAIPVSYSMYKSYQNALEAEKVLAAVSTLKRDCFLSGGEAYMETKDGALFVNGEQRPEFKHLRIETDTGIIIYGSGTASGGTLKVTVGETHVYLVEISSPLGELRLRRGG